MRKKMNLKKSVSINYILFNKIYLIVYNNNYNYYLFISYFYFSVLLFLFKFFPEAIKYSCFIQNFISDYN